jgi:5'-nucleotidase (lipoprotein e(P4) family)
MLHSKPLALGLAGMLLAGLALGDTVPHCVTNQPQTSQNYDATHWYRNSAERNALYRQTYRTAYEKVQQKSRANQPGHWGVILDVDETVLDNSQFEKDSILQCRDYDPKVNYAFMDQAVSLATPGAKHFTCGVQKLGGKVVIVTNRNGHFDQKIMPATIDNLSKVGICFDNVVFANSDSDSNKTPRFEAVARGDYSKLLSQTRLGPLKILAYVGDNIQDFPHSKQSEILKLDPEGQTFYGKFGDEYFSLPNPTYGSWQGNPFN